MGKRYVLIGEVLGKTTGKIISLTRPRRLCVVSEEGGSVLRVYFANDPFRSYLVPSKGIQEATEQDVKRFARKY